tara:strand:- start:1497 stop:2174 length:678 start_codon:yes stop_codon:yes gene_type:complete
LVNTGFQADRRIPSPRFDLNLDVPLGGPELERNGTNNLELFRGFASSHSFRVLRGQQQRRRDAFRFALALKLGGGDPLLLRGFRVFPFAFLIQIHPLDLRPFRELRAYLFAPFIFILLCFYQREAFLFQTNKLARHELGFVFVAFFAPAQLLTKRVLLLLFLFLFIFNSLLFRHWNERCVVTNTAPGRSAAREIRQHTRRGVPLGLRAYAPEHGAHDERERDGES